MSGIFNISGMPISFPSTVLPFTMYDYGQRSGAFAILGKNMVQELLNNSDQRTYIPQITARLQAEVSRSWQTSVVQKPRFANNLLATDIYQISMQLQTGPYDEENYSRFSPSIGFYDALEKFVRESFAQTLRNGLLYGFSSENIGEGVVNVADMYILGADSAGARSLTAYKKDELVLKLLNQINELATRMNLVGTPLGVVLVMPQRLLATLQTAGLVATTFFQKEGAGSATVSYILENAWSDYGGDIVFAVDDTLKGKGNAGDDLILVVAPEIPSRQPISTPDTAEMTTAQTLASSTVLQLSTAIPFNVAKTPVAGGMLDLRYDLRATPGWVLRREAVKKLSVLP